MDNSLRQGIAKYLPEKARSILAKAVIGIAGCGGLGSNVCLLLARTGIENFLLLDFDRVEASNLNRQCYFPVDIGNYKTDALKRHLKALNPHITVRTEHNKADRPLLRTLLPLCPIWVEAFDEAENKALLVEEALLAKRFVVSASGIAGFGGPPLERKTLGDLIVVGDFTRDVATTPPLAPRVTWAAAMMSDAVLERLLESFLH